MTSDSRENLTNGEVAVILSITTSGESPTFPMSLGISMLLASPGRAA